MPPRVVDLLEVVEVDDREGKRRSVARTPLELRFGALHEHSPVERAGERIAGREVVQPLFKARALRDVDAEYEKIRRTLLPADVGNAGDRVDEFGPVRAAAHLVADGPPFEGGLHVTFVEAEEIFPEDLRNGSSDHGRSLHAPQTFVRPVDVEIPVFAADAHDPHGEGVHDEVDPRFILPDGAEKGLALAHGEPEEFEFVEQQPELVAPRKRRDGRFELSPREALHGPGDERERRRNPSGEQDENGERR